MTFRTVGLSDPRTNQTNEKISKPRKEKHKVTNLLKKQLGHMISVLVLLPFYP